MNGKHISGPALKIELTEDLRLGYSKSVHGIVYGESDDCG